MERFDFHYGNEENNLNEFIEKVHFAELTETGLIRYTKEWVATSNNSAAVFVEDDNIDLENMDILVNDLEDNVLIKTKFIKLPKNEFVNVNKKSIAYISEKTINVNSLEGYTGNLNIVVPQLNVSIGVFVENNSYKDEALEITNEDSDFENESNIAEEFSELIGELLNQFESKKTKEQQEHDGMKNEFDDELDQACISFTSYEDDVVESIVKDEAVDENNEEENQEENEANKKKIVDKIRYIVNTFIEAPNVDINISDFEEDNTKIDGNIIIEKVNNRYVATIVGIGFRNFKMLDSDDNAYFTFEEGENKFLNKIKNRLKNMYLMTDNDLAELTVTMILDDASEDYEENINIILRDEAIDLVASKRVNTIKIENKNIELSFIDELERRIKLSANLSGTLGMRGFIDDFILKLDSEIKVFDYESENDEFECLTDLLV